MPLEIVWVGEDLDYTLLVRRVLRNKAVSNAVICVQSVELARAYFGCLDRDERGDAFPCLIIIEARIPVLESMTLLSWLREQDEFATVPILLLDAESGIDIQRAKELGATDVVKKDCQNGAISALVARIICEWL